MLDVTDGYRAAITGDVRQMLINAILDLTDPDMTMGAVTASAQASWSKSAQVTNRETVTAARYATLEPGRWLLDGSFRLVPDNPQQLTGETGLVGGVLSGEDGTFPEAVFAQLTFSNVSTLQACAIFFSDDPIDGTARDFTVDVYSNDVIIYTETFTNNTAPSVTVDAFTVYDPTAIRVTITRWSLPGRRARVMEIVPGLYEKWTEDMLATLDIQMRGNFAGLAIPYGTCTLRMDNLDRRFEPRRKDGIFKSIEERQSITVSLGTPLPDGTREYKPVGVFYQHSGGWTTGDNAITMEWNLVDIIGLLADREFITPDAGLPSTLGGWIAALAAQLGVNFEKRWHVDPDYANLTATATDIAGKKCGDILRYVCMATGTWPRADAETGYLTAEPLWSQGNKYDLDNMNSYPVMKANDDLAALIFKLSDGTTEVVSGNATSSDKTLAINNPFIHTKEQALTAARIILSQYGGIKLETVGRGDPASEIGDVDTVWLDESTAATGRRMEQSFSFTGGVLRDCKSVLLQADGSYLYEETVTFIASGTFHIPAHVDKVRIILVGKGSDGQKGENGHVGPGGSNIPGQGTVSGEGEKGADGAGGLVWSGVVNVNPDTDYTITIGNDATFGVYSSANGKVYPYGFTDIASGSSYARTGVANPLPGSGDGGAGGAGGEAGSGYWEMQGPFYTDEHGTLHHHGWDFVVTKEPGEGQEGAKGATGCCVIWWDREEA